MNQHYYLGIDIGTTATKAVAFSDTGAVLAIESVQYHMQHPQPGWSEQDPNEILEGVINCINKVVRSLEPKEPAFLSFSAAMHSVLAIDENWEPLTPSIIWADNRAADIAAALLQSGLGRQFYQATGVPVHSMSPLCKLLWLKQYQPAVFEKASTFIGIKEYVFLKLFNACIVDTSLASATGLLHLESLQWHAPILAHIGITEEQLSPVVPTKHVLHYTGDHPRLSIPVNTPIVIGGSDGGLSNLGTTGKDSNALVATIGTSGAVRILSNKFQTDANMRTFCYHVKDHVFIIGGATNNGAIVLQWLKETLLQTEDSYEALLKQAETISAGSEGLLFLPYLLGERAPIWNANAKGVFFGLSVQHSKAHLVRSALEGVIYCLYSIGSVLFEQQVSSDLFATGGFARSDLWLQILADVFNRKVKVSSALESAALGAVILGAEATGMIGAFENKVEKVYHPDAANHAVYQKEFVRFQRLYEAVKGEMK